MGWIQTDGHIGGRPRQLLQEAGDGVPSRTMNEPDTGFFEEIEHTADLALRCGGPDLASLFRSAARGMYHLMGVEAQELKADNQHRIRLEAEDVESLLVDWLGELAYLAEARGLIFEGMTFETLSATRLEAMLRVGLAPISTP